MLHYVFLEFIYDRRLVDILESSHVEDPSQVGFSICIIFTGI